MRRLIRIYAVCINYRNFHQTSTGNGPVYKGEVGESTQHKRVKNVNAFGAKFRRRLSSDFYFNKLPFGKKFIIYS